MSNSNKMSALNLKNATTSQIELHLKELEIFNSKVELLFDEQREKINSSLVEIYEVLGSRNYQKYLDLQSKALVLRQGIQDSITSYMQKLSTVNSDMKKSYSDRVEYYMTGYGLKVTDSTRAKLIEKDLSESARYKDLLENHIEYLRECRIGCDQIGYAIKNTVGLLQYISVS